MKTYSAFLFTLLVFLNFAFMSCNTKTQKDNESTEWISILSEDNFDDWTVKIRGYEIGDNYANTFQIGRASCRERV